MPRRPGFDGDFGFGFVIPYPGLPLADERLLVRGLRAEREIGEPGRDLGGLVAGDWPAELGRAVAVPAHLTADVAVRHPVYGTPVAPAAMSAACPRPGLAG